MTPSHAGMPPESRAVAPVEIEPYLEYARENIERSRMLFGKGDLRYAVFSANEGLELCVKAYMLHYGIITKAVAAGHFPYPAAVKKMIETTKSNIGRNPPNKKQLEQALDLLYNLQKAFDMMKNKDLQAQLWKSSLSIRLADNKREEFDKFWKAVSDWGAKMTQIQTGHQHPCEQTRDKCIFVEQSKLIATASNVNKDKSSRREAYTSRSPLNNKKISGNDVLDTEQLFAQANMIILLGVVAPSSAHQQISRYPTKLDGVDSQKIYAKHKDDVKNLLAKIYFAVEKILKHLKHGAPFLLHGTIDMSDDVKKFVRPNGRTRWN